MDSSVAAEDGDNSDNMTNSQQYQQQQDLEPSDADSTLASEAYNSSMKEDEERKEITVDRNEKDMEQEEEKSSQSESPSSSQQLILHSSSPTTTSTERKRLLPYETLFGKSRTALAQHRTERLNQIDAAYDEAMHERDIARIERELIEQAEREQIKSSREHAQELHQRTKHDVDLHRLHQRMQDKQKHIEYLRDRELEKEKKQSDAIARRKFEYECAKQEVARKHELAKIEMLQHHAEIERKWLEQAEQQKFYAEQQRVDKKKRMKENEKETKKHQMAWKKEVQKLDLKDPSLKQHALPVLMKSALVPQTTKRTSVSPKRRPPSAPEAADNQTASLVPSSPATVKRLTSPNGGNACTARLPSLPSYGKATPRHPNPINHFPSEQQRSQSTSPTRRTHSNSPVRRAAAADQTASGTTSRSTSTSPARKQHQPCGASSRSDWCDESGHLLRGAHHPLTSSISFWPTSSQIEIMLNGVDSTQTVQPELASSAPPSIDSSSDPSTSASFAELAALLLPIAPSLPTVSHSISAVAPCPVWCFDNMVRLTDTKARSGNTKTKLENPPPVQRLTDESIDEES